MARACVVSTLLLVSWTLFAQPAAPPPAFAVASIRPNGSTSPEATTYVRGGQVEIKNFTLAQLLKTAFDVKDYSFSGPGWMDNLRFDVVAKPPGGRASETDYRPMLRTLLIDRFRIRFHQETKSLPAYALVVDKKGPKLEKGDPARHGMGSGRGMLSATGYTLDEFASLLSGNLDRPVRNLTDFPGFFDFKLRWSVDDTDPAAISLFAAIQEQLGLRLEGRRMPIEILIIDSAEKTPVEN
jgi:uncharacterized protein (TIGR03435 family)